MAIAKKIKILGKMWTKQWLKNSYKEKEIKKYT